jgi:methionine-rich copper-binding protein CopC
MRLKAAFVSLVIGGVIVAGGSALAHGDLRRADPEEGVHLRKLPKVVELSFAEPPTADSRFEVLDGCRQDVLAEVSGEGPDARLELDEGAPGRWKVSYRVVSSVDGHLVRGSYSFHVRNKKPCEPEPEASDDIGEAASPIEPEDEEGPGFPLIPALIGAGVVGGAVLIRVFTRT